MRTLMEIEQRIATLRSARMDNASSIRDLEERTMIINDELEKILIRKGELQAAERMKEYFKDEQ
tara:strand:+ start:288 stop:479 length:192 start_codon:yes stop_codon:yes gene_type:complete